MKVRKHLIPVAVFALLLGTAVALAEEPAMQTANGTVVTVQAKANTVSLSVPGEGGAPAKTISLTVDKQTKIVKGGQAIAISDLMPGDDVAVTYKMAGGSTLAVNIGVQNKRG